MVEATANLISANQASEVRPSGSKRVDEIATSFSFNAALAALETRAAQSLATFGGAPVTNGALAAPAADPSGQTNAPASNASVPPQQHSEAPPATHQASDPASIKMQASPSTPPATPVPANVQTPSTAIVAQASTQAATQPVAAAPRTEITAARVEDAARQQALKAPKSAAKAQQTQALDFAKLIARKLDGGATQFEFRLDPPELGRVEAHLRLGDKDDAALVLKFENQTALDMFARDEAALRLALASSGQDFSDKRFIFELAEEQADTPAADAPALAAANLQEPLFAAPFSSGALDIRI